MALLSSGGAALASCGAPLASTPPAPPPATTFALGAGHSDSHPFLVWTDDVLVSSPVWHLAINGIPDRPLPNYDALFNWALDPQAPRDRVFGCLYDGVTGTSNALWRCDDLRHDGAWTKIIGLDWFKGAVAESSITSLYISGVATCPAASGFVAATVVASNVSATWVGTWVLHSHDQGDTWTITKPNTPGATLGLEISPNGQVLVYETVNTIYGTHTVVSVDQGHTWTDHVSDSFLSSQGFWMPKASNATGSLMYRLHNNSATPQVTTDQGVTWTNVAVPIAVGEPAGGILSGPDTDDATIAYWEQRFTSGHVAVSHDTGATWTVAAALPFDLTALCLPTPNLLLAGMGRSYIWDYATTWMATTDDLLTWTNRDGNLASLFGSESTLVRFCHIFGVS